MDKYDAVVLCALLLFSFVIGFLAGIKSEQQSAHELPDGTIRMERK